VTPEEFIREYEAASNSHDLDQTLGLISDDAVYWFSNGASHSGKDEIAEAIGNNFKVITLEDYCISELRWIAESDEIAVCLFRFDWSGLVHGEQASGSGRGTSVLSRKGDTWEVVHEHLSKGS